jgi:hypothetical protein
MVIGRVGKFCADAPHPSAAPISAANKINFRMRLPRPSTVMPALVAGIHVFAGEQ